MNIELFFFLLYGGGAPLSIFVQNLCLSILLLFTIYRLAARKMAVKKELLFFLLFLATQVVSLLLGADKALSFKGLRDNWALTAGFIAALGLSRFALENVSKFQDFLSISTTIAGLMAIIEFIFGTDFHKQRLFGMQGIGSTNATGFFSHHLTFAGFMGLVLLYFLSELLYGKKRPVIYFGAFFALLSLLLSQSRGYIVVTLLVLPLLLYNFSKRFILKTVLSVLILLTLVVLVAPSGVRSRVVSTFSMKKGSFAERVYLLKSGLEMFKDRPLFGWGPGCYPKYCETYKNKYDENVVYPDKKGFRTKSHPHNSFLMVLIESGIVGLAFYLSFLGYLCFTIVKSSHHLKFGFLSLLFYFILGGLFEFNLGDAEVVGFFAFLMALFFAQSRQNDN